LFSCSLAQKTDTSSFSQVQIMDFYQQLIHEIELVDAEAIATRNMSKKVSWEEYKKHHEAKFKSIKTDQDFKQKFNAFARGFVNGHSRFEFLYPVQEEEKGHQKSSIKIGYTFPEMSFFDLASKKTITHINDQPIAAVFEHFDNYESAASTTVRSQLYFKIYFEAGRLFIDGQLAKNIRFEDGSKIEVSYEMVEKVDRSYYEGIQMEKYYPDWKRMAVGYKVALLQKENVALIKIKNFIYPNRASNDLRCEEENPQDSTQCADVQLLRKALKAIDKEVDYLIFDLQNNGGGNENSYFLAELCPKPFTDIPVSYRKTHFFENDELRSYLFFNPDKAERWFQEIKQSGAYESTKMGDFLPTRADFCRGAENCALALIAPNDPDAYHFKRYYILVNEATASSSDDITYRMKQFAEAKVVGQTQAADLTYATANILFLIDEKGKISPMYGYGEVKAEPIAEITIPHSRSIGQDGKMLQGNPLKLDIEVKLTKENFEQREERVLEAAWKDTREKN
ncbi:MAG: S41 family peptidase, partial [Bacteroidota bacterium]